MGRSFFTGTYDELYHGSNTFSTLINGDPPEYGVTPAQALSYANLNSAYAAAFLIAKAPETKTTPAIQARNDAAIPLREMASDLAKVIDGTPGVTNQQKLDLGLNVRKTPEPVAAPGTSSDFAVQVLPDGTVVLTWKCNNPPGAIGTTYNVFRRTTPSGPFDFLGTAGQRRFIDATLPANAAQITYQIQAVRSTAIGANAQFLVNFGFNNGGTLLTASVSPVKLAA